MSAEQRAVFVGAVAADSGLQETLKKDADPVVAISKAVDLEISADNLQCREISDEELEGVAAGRTNAELRAIASNAPQADGSRGWR